MRVLVTGSRTWTDRTTIANALHLLANDTVIIHGGAYGADLIADFFAKQYKYEVEPYLISPADWKKYGKSAGPIRNQQMLTEGKPDLVLAFQVGESRGTQDMINRVRKAKIPIDRWVLTHFKERYDTESE